MYNDIKSCVPYNGSQSELFPCFTGVRQGEKIFYFLFSIFLNDLGALLFLRSLIASVISNSVFLPLSISS
jgi:hypothetical protein